MGPFHVCSEDKQTDMHACVRDNSDGTVSFLSPLNKISPSLIAMPHGFVDFLPGKFISVLPSSSEPEIFSPKFACIFPCNIHSPQVGYYFRMSKGKA